MAKKLTTAEFIERANKKHGNHYDYSRVKYINSKTDVEIGCRIHKNYFFWQAPSNHLQGKGCDECGGSKPKTFEEFKLEASQLHGGYYAYYEDSFKNMRAKTLIYCPVHGDFSQHPYVHLKPSGCKKCADDFRAENSRDERFDNFKGRLSEKFSNTISCVESRFINYDTNADFVCKEHNTFTATPRNVINSKYGCSECFKDARKRNTSYFDNDEKLKSWIEDQKSENTNLAAYNFRIIEWAENRALLNGWCGNDKHESYDFVLTRYGNTNKLKKCRNCIIADRSISVSETYKNKRVDYHAKWEADVIELHGDIFDLSKVKYVNQKTNIIVGCQIHDFFTTTPDLLLNGGCRKCADEGLLGLYSEKFFEKHPEKKHEQGEIYYLKLSIGNLAFYKVGITKNQTKSRHSMLNSCNELKWQVMVTGRSSMYKVWSLEQKIQMEHGDFFRLDIPLSDFEIRRIRLGPSECFREELPKTYLNEILNLESN